jgi:hypothetical protein
MSNPAPDTLQALLARSVKLQEAIGQCLSESSFDESAHAALTLSTAQVALEHGVSILVLVELGNLTSANVLLRAQFEASLRAAWFLYVATDDWIDNYLTKAKANPLKDPGCAPGPDDMIRAIERKASEGQAPAGVPAQFKSIKNAAWGPLNSFVHSGIQPTMFQLTGYSADGADGTLRNANALTAISAMFIALLGGDEERCQEVQRIQHQFLDCCPPVVLP